MSAQHPEALRRRSWTRFFVAAALSLILVPGAVAATPAVPAFAALRTPTTVVHPTISGAIAVGSRVTANHGTWRPAGISFTYQWRANGAKISHATNKTFVITASQIGRKVSVSVTGHKHGYKATTRTSATSVAVPARQFPSSPVPTISGAPVHGSTLHANTGSWGVAGVKFTYLWRSNDVTIGGATGTTYVVESANIAQTISVVVTGSASGYVTTTRSSAETSAIPTPPVTGTAATQTQRMSQSTLNSTQLGTYAQGTVLTLVCYQRGQSVKGYFSSSFPNGGWDNLWYRISDGGYAADIDLETGTLDPVVPACADQPVADTTNAQVMATTQRMSSDTLNSTQSGVYGVGTRITLLCYLHGESVQGYFSGSFPNGYDDLWYQVSDGYWVADIDIQTGSNNPVTPACAAPPAPPVSSDEITRAKSWLDAKVPYNQGAYYGNQYGSYREDCSGFVSMALGLSSSYTTVTLPKVMHPITKAELQPGDFMLNSAPGDNGHVAIFMGWADSSHTHYTSWEENGAQGYAFAQVVPYPYWSSWSGSTSYTPYRRN